MTTEYSVRDGILNEGKRYEYRHAHGNPSHAYLLPVLQQVMAGLSRRSGSALRAIDVGCGNGFVSDYIARQGFQVLGVDPSDAGIEIARRNYPEVEFFQGTAYDDLQDIAGQFDLTVSLEVVEHLYSPKKFADTLFAVTKPGGTCMVSTPYHGYLKNLALAATGRLNKHHEPLSEGGHIKFFSVGQLTALLEGAGFQVSRMCRLGRFPVLAKSMAAVAERPA